MNAFCRVAPSDRFKRRAIVRAGIFFRASDLRSRSCTDVQGRLFVAFFMMRISMCESLVFCSWKPVKRKAPRHARDLRSQRSAGAELQSSKSYYGLGFPG